MSGTDEQTIRYAESLIAGMPPKVRTCAERYHLLKKNGGLAPQTLYNRAKAMARLGETMGDRDPASVTPDDGLRHVARLRNGIIDGWSLHQELVNVRMFLRWVLRCGKSLPLDLHEAFSIKRPHRTAERLPVTIAEWEAMYQTANRIFKGTAAVRAQAILWLLRDGGPRAQGLLSLDVGDVQPDGTGGAFLGVGANGTRLKTGPYRPYIAGESLRAIEAWRSAHPRAGQPDAPLIPTVRPADGSRRATYNSLLIQIRLLAREAGIARRISPHLFRHMKGTQMARDKWAKQNAAKQMGWGMNTRMWDTYTHMVDDDLKAQVRRDAGLDDSGHVVGSDSKACPFCAEPIKSVATKCKHCHEFLKDSADQGHRRPQ